MKVPIENNEQISIPLHEYVALKTMTTQLAESQQKLVDYVINELGKGIAVINKYYFSPEHRRKTQIVIQETERETVIRQMQKVYYAVYYHKLNHTELPKS